MVLRRNVKAAHISSCMADKMKDETSKDDMANDWVRKVGRDEWKMRRQNKNGNNKKEEEEREKMGEAFNNLK